MKIIIDAGERPRLVFLIPTWLVLNNFVASIASKCLDKYGMDITKEQAKTLVKGLRKCVKELRAYKRRHRAWKMLEMRSADGKYIEITM